MRKRSMTSTRNHSISTRLYQSRVFTHFYERIAGRYSAKLTWKGLINDFLGFIPRGSTILEIGAGPGLIAIKVVEQRPDLTVIVSDFSQEMLQLAQEKLKEHLERFVQGQSNLEMQKHLVFVQADAMDLSQFQGRAINGIYSLGAIKHFPDPLKGLDQCVGILSPGGVLYFADFCADGTYAGTREIIKHVQLPSILKFVMVPFLHLANKREAPSSQEVENWNCYLQSRGKSRIEYSTGRTMFGLIFESSTLASDNNPT